MCVNRKLTIEAARRGSAEAVTRSVLERSPPNAYVHASFPMNTPLKRSNCDRCLRPQPFCLCPHIPLVRNQTRILVLQHESERKHALNTARLAVLGLEQAEIWIGEAFPELAARVSDAHHAYMLFPGDGAVTPQAVQRGGASASMPDLLIVPDGTWRKARKVLHANPILATLPRMALAGTSPSTYRLRKASEPDALSTIEAIVQTLGALEPHRDFSPLLKPFNVLIEQQIASMGAAVYTRNYRSR